MTYKNIPIQQNCKKKDRTCRFSFPRSPSSKTLIEKKTQTITENTTEFVKRKAENKHILSGVYDSLQKQNPDLSFDDLLANSQVTEERYLQALKETSCKTTIILQKDPLECFVINYNQDLLSI